MKVFYLINFMLFYNKFKNNSNTIMKRILVALESDFTNGIFRNNFINEGFDVVGTTTSGIEALKLINTHLPDMAILDANLDQISGFEVLSAIRGNEATRRVPVIIYSKSGSESHYEMALDYEANDFIVGISDSPKSIVTKVKSLLGEQKAYIFDVDNDINTVIELARDLGYRDDLKCPNCGSPLKLHLLRNLNFGKNIFTVSLICSSCPYRFSAN